MESTTRSKPKILYTGAPSGQDFNAMEEVGEVFVQDHRDGLKRAEVLWVDCGTTKSGQYQPLLKTALDSGVTLVMKRPDSNAHEALSRIVGSRLEANGMTLMVTRDSRTTTPVSYALEVLDDGTSHLEGASTLHGWSRRLAAHRGPMALSVGGPGLIPPTGVMFGIRTFSGSRRVIQKITGWPSTEGKSQLLEFEFTNSFYVYRENGGPDTSYVVIRVQRATSRPGPLMVDTNDAKGLWQFAMRAECSHDRGTDAFLGTSPATTNGPSIITQLAIPLRVRYLQDGSCLPGYWFATHGPVARMTDGWGFSNESDFIRTAPPPAPFPDPFPEPTDPIPDASKPWGKAVWRHFHRAPWHSLEDPQDEFARWESTRYDTNPLRVKNLNLQASSLLTIENAAAWRFTSEVIDREPEVTFSETLSHQFIAFATPTGSGKPTNQRFYVYLDTADKKKITLDLPQITDDVTSPCR